MIYSAGPKFTVSNWESLEPYSVGYIIGWQILEKNITITNKVTKVKNPRQLFSLIQNKRIDLIIYERWGGLWWLKKLGMNIKPLKPHLAKRELYLYLNKKHKHLIPLVAQALVEMKKDGTYQRIFDETLSILIN